MVGSKMSKWRRYLYLLVDRYDKQNYPMRRIDASTLFFPINHKTTTPTGIEDARLPPPFISFTASPSDDFGSRILDFFALFGHGEKKSLVASADENGFTVMYDLDQRTLHDHLRLNEHKQFGAVSLNVGDSLYVMDRFPHVGKRCGFEALEYVGEPSKYDESIKDWRWHWRWRCLDPPPYVLAPGYESTRISAYTIVNGSDIWISSPNIGTYSFNTSSGTWSKAGKWVLPFRDRADYIPECNSWLGFTSGDGLLCSLDLSTASWRTKPVVSSVLEEHMQVCQGCNVSRSYLVRLDSAKFCAAKFFQKNYKDVSEEGYVITQIERFVVLTGFVMDLDGPGGVLRMRKHKSRRYIIPTMSNGWVF